MNAYFILKVINETYKLFKEKAEGTGKDPNSLKDFMWAIEIFLQQKLNNIK